MRCPEPEDLPSAGAVPLGLGAPGPAGTGAVQGSLLDKTAEEFAQALLRFPPFNQVPQFKLSDFTVEPRGHGNQSSNSTQMKASSWVGHNFLSGL